MNALKAPPRRRRVLTWVVLWTPAYAGSSWPTPVSCRDCSWNDTVFRFMRHASRLQGCVVGSRPGAELGIKASVRLPDHPGSDPIGSGGFHVETSGRTEDGNVQEGKALWYRVATVVGLLVKLLRSVAGWDGVSYRPSTPQR